MEASLAETSPITPATSPPVRKGSRFGQLPKGPFLPSFNVPLPPPGVVILNIDADQKPLPTIKVDPKANLLSQLFLHSGLYNLPSIPDDLMAFYRSYFRPLVNPYQVQRDCFVSLMEDMKTVIMRDLERRIIHTHLFKAFDAWTEKNQREYNQRVCIVFFDDKFQSPEFEYAFLICINLKSLIPYLCFCFYFFRCRSEILR